MPPAVRRWLQHAQLLDFGTLAAARAELEHLDVARAGHAVLVDGLFLFGNRAPQHEQLADVLDRGSVEFVGKLLVDLIARGAIVVEDADLDEAVCIQGRVNFFLPGGCEAIAADHDHGVEMVGVGAVFPALGGSQLNLGHGPYYLGRTQST